MDAQQVEQIEDQAMQWIAHLSNDLAPAESFEQFALWLDVSPAHGVVFDEMLDLWVDMGLACKIGQKLNKRAS